MSELKRAIEIPPGHLIRSNACLFVTMESEGVGRRILRLTYCIGSTEVTEHALFEDLGPVTGLAKNYRGLEVSGPGEMEPRLWSVSSGGGSERLVMDASVPEHRDEFWRWLADCRTEGCEYVRLRSAETFPGLR